MCAFNIHSIYLYIYLSIYLSMPFNVITVCCPSSVMVLGGGFLASKCSALWQDLITSSLNFLVYSKMEKRVNALIIIILISFIYIALYNHHALCTWHIVFYTLVHFFCCCLWRKYNRHVPDYTLHMSFLLTESMNLNCVWKRQPSTFSQTLRLCTGMPCRKCSRKLQVRMRGR